MEADVDSIEILAGSWDWWIGVGVDFEVRPCLARSFMPCLRPPYCRLLARYRYGQFMWTSIEPVLFANAREKKPFCPLLIWVGVKPKTRLRRCGGCRRRHQEYRQSNRFARD